ncbi:polyphosphate kinase 2 [Tepidamorphus sp. 3E244]|uniref:polyphosphate kinase 2 n=1 Tax=Tepidamorphus sp. 3E244 TaxID=3385498 RepID=UPI0038FC42A9
MGKKSKKSASTDVVEPFDIDDPELPAWVEEDAFESGGYPYDERMKRKKYNKKLVQLHIELMKLQRHIVETGERIAIVFEGRDSAGKGGTIKRLIQHLNPRIVRVVALSKPTDEEQGQWYFQRYVEHMPTAGEIVIFDRSWYNRAGVEPVMGFSTPEETRQFLHAVPSFERMLTDDGIRLVKFWLDIGQEMQLKRLHARRHDPLKQWKLSDIDIKGIGLWDAYTRARDVMLRRSDTVHAPWTIVQANDKLRLRLNVMRCLLNEFIYQDRDTELIGMPDPKLVHSADQFLAQD